MTKGEFMFKAQETLDRIASGGQQPMEIHETILELAREIESEHTRYGRRSKWDQYSANAK